MSQMKRVNVLLPKELVSELKELAKSEGLSYSELIRQAVRKFININNKS